MRITAYLCMLPIYKVTININKFKTVNNYEIFQNFFQDIITNLVLALFYDYFKLLQFMISKASH